MAFNETFSTTSGRTVYAQIWRRSDGQIWSVAGSVFEAYLDAHWANYAVAMPEQGTSGVYLLTSPAGIGTVLVYDVLVFAQAGGSPAKSDIPAIGNGTIGPASDNAATPNITITPLASYQAGAPLTPGTITIYAGYPMTFQISPTDSQGNPVTMVGPVKLRFWSGTPDNTIYDSVAATLSNSNKTATVAIPANATGLGAPQRCKFTWRDTGQSISPLGLGNCQVLDAGPTT